MINFRTTQWVLQINANLKKGKMTGLNGIQECINVIVFAKAESFFQTVTG